MGKEFGGGGFGGVGAIESLVDEEEKDREGAEALENDACCQPGAIGFQPDVGGDVGAEGGDRTCSNGDRQGTILACPGLPSGEVPLFLGSEVDGGESDRADCQGEDELPVPEDQGEGDRGAPEMGGAEFFEQGIFLNRTAEALKFFGVRDLERGGF